LIEIPTAHLIPTYLGAFAEPSSSLFAYQTSKKTISSNNPFYHNSLSGSPKEAVKYGLSHYQAI
jgi:hypothetical protein